MRAPQSIDALEFLPGVDRDRLAAPKLVSSFVPLVWGATTCALFAAVYVPQTIARAADVDDGLD